MLGFKKVIGTLGILGLIPVGFILSGCNNNSTNELTKEEYITEYNKVNSNVNNIESLKNYRINSIVFENEYNFKENDFYMHKEITRALMVPINLRETYAYKENNKFYHSEMFMIDDSCFIEEVDEDKYNQVMTDGRKAMKETAVQMMATVDKFLNETIEFKTSISNKYVISNGEYTFTSIAKAKDYEDSSDEIERELTFKFKDGYPTYMKLVNKTTDSNEEGWEFIYNGAKFEKPTPRK